MQSPEESKERQRTQAMLGFGWTMVGTFVFLPLGGFALDTHFKSGYAWTLFGLFLALVYVAYELWKMLKEEEKRTSARQGLDTD